MARRKRVLTEDQERTIREALAAGATDEEARIRARISARRLYQARQAELRDLPRQRRGPRTGRVYMGHRDFVEIPIEEVYRRAAELRAERWSEDVRRARWNPGFSGDTPG